MSVYHRYYIPGGMYFFTLVTFRRQPILTTPLGRSCLRGAVQKVRNKYPFIMEAVVILPDHLHTIWSMPEDDSDFSTRWRRIKEEFTKTYLANGGMEIQPSESGKKKKERGIWQRRFWEHSIRDEQDFEQHLDYIHYNPVKHGLVKSPHDWPYSSFSKWVKKGVYDEEWGGDFDETIFDDLDGTAME